MSIAPENTVVLVTGVGRSGTSIAMQALARLGATISRDLVAASEANRRGPLEDMQVRNQMLALWKRLGSFDGLRPEDWRQSHAAREAETWLSGHLARMAGRGGGVYAVKYPLSALFLPLWCDAASAVAVRLKVVWATRDAEATISSFVNAYDFTHIVAESRYLQRSFYVLTEMPADTFLLPYEGWVETPSEQLTALANAACLPKPDDVALEGLYAPEIAHTKSPGGLAPCAEAARALDQAISGHRGPAREIIGLSEEPSRIALTWRLHNALVESKGAKSGAGDARHAAMNLSIDALTKEIGRMAAERTTKDAEATDLRRENESSQAKLTELRSAYAELVRERDAAETAQADALRRENESSQAKLTELRSAYAELVRERDAAETAQADLRADRANEIALERNRAANNVKTQLNKEVKKLREAEDLIKRMRASARWRLGGLFSGALRRPGRQTFSLPVQLVKFWLRRRRQ